MEKFTECEVLSEEIFSCGLCTTGEGVLVVVCVVVCVGKD